MNHLMIYGYTPVFLFGLLGLIKYADRRKFLLLIPTGSYLFFIIFTSIFKIRYRLMIEPVLIVFASIYLEERYRLITRWWRERRARAA